MCRTRRGKLARMIGMTDTEETDEALIARYALGDAPAFDSLYRRHEMRVWRYLQRNARNPAIADELMQDVWFAVARDAGRYQPTARFSTWLFTIAHNRMIDSIRADRRQRSLDTLGYEASALIGQLVAESGAGPVAAAVARDQASALTRAVEGLPIDQRQAFLLQVEGGLSVEEIATITHSSFETTKSRLRYARTKLRESLKEYA
jgi:RNA polymerase sigma factor (sigma-70 family)